VVKVSKPVRTCLRLPVIGLPTIEHMKKAQATALAVDAGRTLLSIAKTDRVADGGGHRDPGGCSCVVCGTERAFGGNEQGMTAATQRGKIRLVPRCWTVNSVESRARLPRNSDAELVGVFDKSTERSQAAATEFRTHASLLSTNCAPVDAVSVAVPTADTLRSASADGNGLEVLVGEPMAKSLARRMRLLDAAKRYDACCRRPLRTINPAVAGGRADSESSAFFRGAPAGVFTPAQSRCRP